MKAIRMHTSKFLALMGMAVTSVVVLWYLIHPSFIQYFIHKTTDVILATAEPKSSNGAVVVVDLDEKSLNKYGQWPWPRFRLAYLMEKIRKLGATSIGLNMILAEPDRTSPEVWQQALNKELKFQIDLEGVPRNLLDFDSILAETLSKGPFVLGFEFLFEDRDRESSSCRLHPINIVRVRERDSVPPLDSLFKARSVDCSLAQLSSTVSHSGFLNAAPDSDGLLRRIPLLMMYGDQVFPCFALSTLMKAKRTSQLLLKEAKSGQIFLLLENKPIPIDKKGHIALNFSSPIHKLNWISASDVLGEKVSRNILKDKIVFIASSASGLENIYQTPGKPIFHEVAIHAQLVNSILTENFIFRNHNTLLLEAALGVILAICYFQCIARLGVLWNGLIGGLIVIGVWLGSINLFENRGILFSPLLPTAVVLFNYVVLMIYKYWRDDYFARKEVNNALVSLKTSEAKLESIITTIPDIVFRLDTLGRITFISPAITKYNCSPDDLIGQPMLDIVEPADKNSAEYKMNERRTGKRATTGLELRLRLFQYRGDHGESERYFIISAEGIYEEGRPSKETFLGTQGIIRDVTEHKRLQNQLMVAKKLEGIGSLAAGVAHDLNNILSGLVGYPELLLLDLPKESPIRETVLTIKKSGQKAADIVQDLLTLSRQGVDSKETVNLNTVVSDYLTSPEFNMLVQNHSNIRVEIDLQPDLMHIKGSLPHISKIIMNLLTNAAEAMPAGGQISIHTFNRYLDTQRTVYEPIPEGEYVILSIADEGVGISQEDLKHIFEPFYTKKDMGRSGTGLGMTVIWATIKDHGGYIDVQSREGEGTRMSIYFPSTRDLPDENTQRVVLQDYIGTERILVVDDIAEQCVIAEKMLSKLGYEVISVTSGESAVSYLETHNADLIVLDMIMPDSMDGLETYRRIIEVHPGQKAIIASGFSESDRVKTLQELGAGAYVQKPYTLEKIGLAVRAELDASKLK